MINHIPGKPSCDIRRANKEHQRRMENFDRALRQSEEDAEEEETTPVIDVQPRILARIKAFFRGLMHKNMAKAK